MENYTYEIEEPTDAGGGRFRCHYHILNGVGRKVHGKSFSIELASAESAKAEAEFQARSEVARLKGEPPPRRPVRVDIGGVRR